MKLRHVFLVLIATGASVMFPPFPASAQNYSLEAVPLYEVESRIGSPSTVYEAVVTSSLEEKIALETRGYTTVSIFYVSPAQIPGTVPFYRLFDPKSGDHLCTTSGIERQTAIDKGFRPEGLLGYVFPREAKGPGTVPLHRFYEPYEGPASHAFHIYNTDEQLGLGKYEAIACYVWPGPTQIATLTITAPRPGKTLVGGSEYEVQWSASAKTGAISIGYSADSGYSWTETDCGLPNKEFATWRVPNIDTDRARLRITWTDAATGPTNVLAIAESEADLRIKNTPLAALPSKSFQVAGAPTKPAGVKAEALSAAEIRLSWQATRRNTKGYLVERRTGRQPFRVIANVLPPAVTFTDNHISPGTSYEYRVRAYGDGTSSGYSDVVSVKTRASLRAEAPRRRQPNRLPPVGS